MGGVYSRKDEHRFTAPDQGDALRRYPEGVMVSDTTNLRNGAGNTSRFAGDKGPFRLDGSKATHIDDGVIHRDGSIRGANTVEPIEQTEHWVNWYRCMRDGKTRNASLDAGYQHAVAGIIGRRCRTGRAAGRGSTPDGARSRSTEHGPRLASRQSTP